MPGERAEIGVRVQGHAGVAVPDQSVAVQRRRPRQLVRLTHAQSPHRRTSRPARASTRGGTRSIRASGGKSSRLVRRACPRVRSSAARGRHARGAEGRVGGRPPDPLPYQWLDDPCRRGVKMMTELAGKTCVPCRGGVPPMPKAEAEGYLREAPGWTLIDDGKRIERKFKLQGLQGSARLRQPGRGDRRGRGPPPGHHLRLGLRHSIAAHPQDQRPARERLHHGGQDQPPRRGRGLRRQPMTARIRQGGVSRREATTPLLPRCCRPRRARPPTAAPRR